MSKETYTFQKRPRTETYCLARARWHCSSATKIECTWSVGPPIDIDWFVSIQKCNTLRHTATHCNTLQHTATHCNTLRWPTCQRRKVYSKRNLSMSKETYLFDKRSYLAPVSKEACIFQMRPLYSKRDQYIPNRPIYSKRDLHIPKETYIF